MEQQQNNQINIQGRVWKQRMMNLVERLILDTKYDNSDRDTLMLNAKQILEFDTHREQGNIIYGGGMYQRKTIPALEELGLFIVKDYTDNIFPFMANVLSIVYNDIKKQILSSEKLKISLSILKNSPLSQKFFRKEIRNEISEYLSKGYSPEMEFFEFSKIYIGNNPSERQIENFDDLVNVIIKDIMKESIDQEKSRVDLNQPPISTSAAESICQSIPKT